MPEKTAGGDPDGGSPPATAPLRLGTRLAVTNADTSGRRNKVVEEGEEHAVITRLSCPPSPPPLSSATALPPLTILTFFFHLFRI